MARRYRRSRRSGLGSGKKLLAAALIGLGCAAILGKGIPSYAVAYVAGGPVAVGGALFSDKIASMAQGVVSNGQSF